MEPREAVKGLLDLYEMIWEEVGKKEKLGRLDEELKKDIATSVFIQMTRAGITRNWPDKRS